MRETATMIKIDKGKTIRSILADPDISAFRKYRCLTAGNAGFPQFVLVEVVTSLLGSLPGALGLITRRVFYRRLFKSCGRGVVIGRNCVFRNPASISIGNNVVFDDNCVIDARGAEDEGLVFDDGVLINRNVSVQSKGGDIRIGHGVSIGADSQLVSWSGLRIGDRTAVAAGCFFSAGSYELDDFETPLSERQPISAGPIVVGKNVWIATRSVILDGVKINDNAVVSAGAIVKHDVGAKCVVHGDPAKTVFEGR